MKSKKSRKTLQAVIDHYGADHQLAKTVEELTELIHVIARRQQSGVMRESTALFEEMADVYVMLDQLKLICCAEMDITLQKFNNVLDSHKRAKIKRTIQRMQEEKQLER